MSWPALPTRSHCSLNYILLFSPSFGYFTVLRLGLHACKIQINTRDPSEKRLSIRKCGGLTLRFCPHAHGSSGTWRVLCKRSPSIVDLATSGVTTDKHEEVKCLTNLQSPPLNISSSTPVRSIATGRTQTLFSPLLPIITLCIVSNSRKALGEWHTRV